MLFCIGKLLCLPLVIYETAEVYDNLVVGDNWGVQCLLSSD